MLLFSRIVLKKDCNYNNEVIPLQTHSRTLHKKRQKVHLTIKYLPEDWDDFSWCLNIRQKKNSNLKREAYFKNQEIFAKALNI